MPDVSIELAEYVPATQISPAAHAQQSELICLARQSVESLPPTYREVVQLSVLGAMPDDAVADLLGIPLGTVKSRKHRALAALRENSPGMRNTTNLPNRRRTHETSRIR